MVKKVTRASSTIGDKPQQQLSCLMKVLKPKVYITDISSFKRLVQELTGNNSNPTNNNNNNNNNDNMSPMISSPVITNTTKESETKQQQLKNDDYSSCELRNQTTTINQLISNQEYGHGLGLSQYPDLETWLLDMEPMVSLCESYGGGVEEEFGFCNYDYDLSGLL